MTQDERAAVYSKQNHDGRLTPRQVRRMNRWERVSIRRAVRLSRFEAIAAFLRQLG